MAMFALVGAEHRDKNPRKPAKNKNYAMEHTSPVHKLLKSS